MSTADTFQKLDVKHSSMLNDMKSGFCNDHGVPSAPRGFPEDAFCQLQSSPPTIRSENLALVGVLPGTGRILCGVAVLSAELFVVRNFSSVIDVYDVRTDELFCPRRRHNIAGLRDPVDIAACPNQKALYVSGSNDRSVFRISGSGKVLGRWLLDSRPFGISVCRQSGTICVTFLDEAVVKEFSPDGAELRAIRLDTELLSNPWHAVTLPLGNSGKRPVRGETTEDENEEEDRILLVCHGWTKDRLNSVSLVNGADGRVTGRYGGKRGSGSGCVDLPSHILLECTRGGATKALVVDLNNSRILRLRVPELGAGGGGAAETVLSDSNGLKWPRSLAVDDDQGLLYVGLHEGQVLIFEYTR